MNTNIMTPFNPNEFLILVVDDISQNLQVIGEMLEQEGYETTFATSGQQALERIKAAQPNLILLDLMMPGMSGIEVCEKVKSNPEFSKIPIIFLTASNEQNDLLEAFKKGAADYITKPFRPEEVLARIKIQLINQKLQQELEAQNNRLQLEIEAHQLTEEALQKALEIAESANRAKSIFLANMSHELRTPLNAILGFAQLMSSNANLSIQEQKNVEIIRRSGEHLLNLINDILDLSKIEAGRMMLNDIEFSLIDMLLEVEEMFRFKATQKNLQLEIAISPDIPQYIKDDRVKIRQILINLVSNAIKFTKAGSVKLSISPVNNNQETSLSFEVADTGVGIAPEELAKLFQPFVQTQAGIASSEGTGLGLAISRKYVELLGGTMNVKSEVGKGTTFQFQIIVHPTTDMSIISQMANHRPIGLAPNQPSYRLLVVDDKLSNRELMVQMLSRVGFEVKEAENGLQAIEIWQEFEPHLIWMDMRMPVMNGYEATQKIKSQLKGQATAIIAITAGAFPVDKHNILSAGCDDIVYKPIEESVIFDKIAQHLGARYIYEENNSSLLTYVSPIENLSALQTLPDSLLDRLQEAALGLDEEELYNIISQISPHQTALAELLRLYIDNFEYHKIIEAIELTKKDCFSGANLSPEWVDQMQKAVERADIDLMDSLIDRLKSENPDLAERLQNHLDNFEYHKIINLIL